MITPTTLKETYDNLNNYFSNGGQHYIIHEKTEVSYGNQNDINIEYCIEHNIPYYNLQRDGGCIVYSAGNVSWADVRSNKTRDFKLLNIDFLEKFNHYLQAKGINAIQDNNDILVDGYKVASGCAINLPPDYKKTFTCVNISINVDIEAITNICMKPMKKTPKGLFEYGITTNELEQFILEYFEEDQPNES